LKNCTVIGLGKIGLPLAVSIAEFGYKVTGLDINSKIVDGVNLGEVPTGFDEPGLGGKLKNVVADKNLIATMNAADAIKNADVIVVIVPLTLNSEGAPAFEALDSVTRSIGENLKKGSLIIYETTLPIGTTRNRFTKMIAAISGFKDSEYYVVFSPERVFVGAFLTLCEMSQRLLVVLTKNQPSWVKNSMRVLSLSRITMTHYRVMALLSLRVPRLLNLQNWLKPLTEMSI
jgi:nucleotide sugar dehydrogenase